MTGYFRGDVVVVQCRFCGTKVLTNNELVEGYLIANGCPACQHRFNETAERLLQQVETFKEEPPKAA